MRERNGFLILILGWRSDGNGGGGHERPGARSTAWGGRGTFGGLFLVGVDAQILAWLGHCVDEFLLIWRLHLVLLLRASRNLQARRLGPLCRRLACLTILGLLVLCVNVFRLREAVLEEGRGAGAFEACQTSIARAAAVGGGEGGGAGRVVDVQVVLVPVAAMGPQPSLLWHASVGVWGAWGARGARGALRGSVPGWAR